MPKWHFGSRLDRQQSSNEPRFWCSLPILLRSPPGQQRNANKCFFFVCLGPAEEEEEEEVQSESSQTSPDLNLASRSAAIKRGGVSRIWRSFFIHTLCDAIVSSDLDLS